ncbi:MAG: DUF3048 domain-containing protein [Clostridiales bacterium]|nr:DUF3048 domain-containing protein [Clostridiales bacterium]
MKRIVSLLLVLALLLGIMPLALADTAIDPGEKRKIKLEKVGLNEGEEGMSPTTGLPLEDLEQVEGFAGLAVTGRYMPMLVQIDNTDGGVDKRAPWGVSFADIVYETPLHKNGNTRLTFLFSDLIPDSVGPVRSARMGHVWLREEWDAGFLYYGYSEYDSADCGAELRKWKVEDKGLAFSGTVSNSKPWKQYYTRRKGVAAPHNVDANVSAMYDLIDKDFVAPNHTFLFTDELPEGEQADEIHINTGHKSYSSTLIYDIDTNLYNRYLGTGDDLTPYEDLDTQDHIGFSNVIIQFTEVKWPRVDAPVAFQAGQKYYDKKGSYEVGGNADFFMGGVRVKGYWNREDMESRTVFYTADGEELQLQRGKTLIVIADSERWKVSYEAY